MRSLAQPKVLTSAMTAALFSALASCPRLLVWDNRPYVLWFYEAILFLCGIVLWAFVFAWHTKYSHRPVFTLRPGSMALAVATVSALLLAVVLHRWLDPVLRTVTPEEYPKTLQRWIALVLWTLSYLQLFLIFAPFAWCLRLFQHTGMAATLTILFGVFVMVLKDHSSAVPAPWGLFGAMLVTRLAVGTLSIYLYLRGGVILVWWWGLLVQSRHLWTIEYESNQ